MARMAEFAIKFRMFPLYLAAVMVGAGFLIATITTARTNDRLVSELEDSRRVAATERRDARAERQVILDGQRDLQAKYGALVESNKALLLYLRERGIYVPADLIPPESADASTVHADSPAERARKEAASRPKGQSPSPSGDGGGSSTGGNSGGGDGGGGSSNGGSKSGGQSSTHSHGQNAGGRSSEHRNSRGGGSHR